MLTNEDQQTVAEAVAEELASAGVDRVFGLPGGEVLWIMESLRQRGIEYVLCRHEADAGIMAAVYGKLRGTVGVVLTTLGPGAANLMLALSNSYLDREPLLAISADIPTTWPVSHTHQRLPLLEAYGPIVKSAARIDPFNVYSIVRDAIDSAVQEPLGPTLLTLSADDAAASVLSQPLPERQRGVRLGAEPGDSLIEGSVAASVQSVSDALAGAERPLVLVGLGARAEHAPALLAWLDRWDLPFAVTPKVKGIVDETDDRFLGVVGGMSIDSLMVEALQQADLLVGIGFDPVELDKTWHAELPILWVLESPLVGGITPRDNAIIEPHSALLEALGATTPPREWGDVFTTYRDRRAETYKSEGGSGAEGTIFPTTIVRALADVLPTETIVTTDVGSHKYLFGQFWPSRKPNTFFMSNGLSGMGYGLPAAIGAKLAYPQAPVLAVLGDGGFSMNSQELETAQRIGAPIITLVLEDKSYSLIRHGQAKRRLPNYGVDFNRIDSVLTAKACGVHAVRVSDPAQLAEEVKRAVECNESLLVEVPVDPEAWRDLV